MPSNVASIKFGSMTGNHPIGDVVAALDHFL